MSDAITPEEAYIATVRGLQELAAKLPHVTQDDVLDIASMPAEELRRRALIGRDWHGHFSHCLDGIKELLAMPGAAPDGCCDHHRVRGVVEPMLERSGLTWENDYRGRLKDS